MGSSRSSSQAYFTRSVLCTIINALERRSLYVEYKDDWESAIQVLEDVGLLPNIQQMEKDLQSLEVLKATYEDLLEKLKEAGGNEAKLRESYEYAYETITNHHATVESIIPCLRSFSITENFWKDVKRTFNYERVKFYSLQSYLLRIAHDPNAYPIKNLAGHASGHYEYRTGMTHRLYFRREDDRIIWERFGHKNEQKEILNYLRNTGGGDVFPLDNINNRC